MWSTKNNFREAIIPTCKELIYAKTVISCVTTVSPIGAVIVSMGMCLTMFTRRIFIDGFGGLGFRSITHGGGTMTLGTAITVIIGDLTRYTTDLLIGLRIT